MEKLFRLLLRFLLLFSLLAALLPYVLGIAAGLFALRMMSHGIPLKYALMGFLFVTLSVVIAIKEILNNKKE